MALKSRSKTVTLNSVDYAVVNGEVRVEPFEAWANPVRTIGNQRRGDRINANQQVYEDLSFGLGFFSTQGDPPVDGQPGHPSFSGFFNSTVETRFNGQVTLPGLIEAVGHTSDAGSGDDHTYYRLFEAPNATSPVSTGLYCASDTALQDIGKFNGATDNFDVFQDLAAVTNGLPRAIFDFEGSTYIMGGSDSAAMTVIGKINYAGVWSAPTITTAPTGTVLSATTYRGVAYALAYVSTTGNVTLWSATDPEGVWTTENIVLGIPGWRHAELVVYRDASGRPALFANTDEALYILDLGNQEPLLAVKYPQKMDEQARRRGRPIEHKGRLYIPRGPALWEYHFTGAYRDISPLSQAKVPTGTDGFKPAVGSGQAQITSIASGSDWLMVAFSGHTKASVWAYDGKGYHYMWSKLSGDTDLIHIEDIAVHYDRTTKSADLFVLLEEVGATDNVNFEKIENVLDDPLQLSGKTFAATGFIILPHTDGGMSEVDSALIQIGVGASDLDTNNEFITVTTELDFSGSFGNSRVFDPVNPATQKLPATADFGAGVSARRWRHRFQLDRGATTTLTPVFYSLVSYYEKVFPDLFRYTFQIDMRETLRINRNLTPAGDPNRIIDKIKTARSSVPLIKFEYGGETSGTARWVRVKDFPHIVEPPGESQASDSIKDAQILIVLEERVP